MKKYYNYSVKKVVKVENFITIEYVDFHQTYTYPEESHSFYEFIYVDEGELYCNCADKVNLLVNGDFFLILPGNKHNYYTKKNQTAKAFITCFSCKSNFIELIEGKSVLDEKQKNLLVNLFEESKNAFEFPFSKKLIDKKEQIFGAQQLIENLIEEILIRLIRSKFYTEKNIKFVASTKEFENNLVNDISQILKNNLYNQLTLSQVAEKTFYSKAHINNIFKKNTGYCVIQYFNMLKINEAKSLLKKDMSTSMVAEKLRFESPNYFSKVFKKITGLTPSEYKKKGKLTF